MNKTAAEAAVFIEGLKKLKIPKERQIIIASPFTLLSGISSLTRGTSLKTAGQNMYFETAGAFTGEISPLQLRDAGATHVIIGHSERRKIFNENDELISKKLSAALVSGLIPIFCIGESKADRDSELTFKILESQLKAGLNLLKPDEINKLIIAYEPVWAIGTGVNATAEQAEEVHLFIKECLQKNYFKNSVCNVKILYGGSVTSENISTLIRKPSISGVLVGGASLNLDSLTSIINFKER